MKTIKVELTDEQHKALKVEAANRCVAMSELVRLWIDENLVVINQVKPSKEEKL